MLEALARQHAPPCRVRIARMAEAPSNLFDAGLQQHIVRVAEAIGAKAMPLLSAAGHDARHMASRGTSAMIFIPCRGGISHSPLEWAEPAHVAAEAAVLAGVAAEITA